MVNRVPSIFAKKCWECCQIKYKVRNAAWNSSRVRALDLISFAKYARIRYYGSLIPVFFSGKVHQLKGMISLGAMRRNQVFGRGQKTLGYTEAIRMGRGRWLLLRRNGEAKTSLKEKMTGKKVTVKWEILSPEESLDPFIFFCEQSGSPVFFRWKSLGPFFSEKKLNSYCWVLKWLKTSFLIFGRLISYLYWPLKLFSFEVKIFCCTILRTSKRNLKILKNPPRFKMCFSKLFVPRSPPPSLVNLQ